MANRSGGRGAEYLASEILKSGSRSFFAFFIRSLFAAKRQNVFSFCSPKHSRRTSPEGFAFYSPYVVCAILHFPPLSGAEICRFLTRN